MLIYYLPHSEYQFKSCLYFFANMYESHVINARSQVFLCGREGNVEETTWWFVKGSHAVSKKITSQLMTSQKAWEAGKGKHRLKKYARTEEVMRSSPEHRDISEVWGMCNKEEK